MEELLADALKGLVAAGPCTVLLFWMVKEQKKEIKDLKRELKETRKDKDKLTIKTLKLANHVTTLKDNDLKESDFTANDDEGDGEKEPDDA